MKKVILLLAVLLAGAASITTGNAVAQTTRLAFVNTQSIYQQLPEHIQVVKTLNEYRQGLQNRFTAQGNSYREKYDALLALNDSTDYSERVSAKTALRQEVNALFKQLQDMEWQKEQAYTEKEAELRMPIRKKVHEAIMAVAQEKSYDTVEEAGNVLYHRPADDITSLVLERLGVSTTK